ncbi:MAG TPA: hypothetical protein VGR31_04220 [Planctomycetota bacterium]|nr:hypothetical protein [Planctomycetota bacterium]
MARVVHLVACAAFVASCGSSNDGAAVRTVERSRVVGDRAVDFHRGDSTADRFGLGASPHGSAAGKAPATVPDGSSGSKSPIAWTVPAGWTELPPTAMRTANFHPGGDPHTDCYLTLLGGDAGGLGANVNRWRAQLSLPALSPSEIDALPRSPFVGGDAVLVEANGTWRGMNGTDSNVGWALTGLLHVDPNGSAFLKMTGPADVVAAQHDAFLQLARSFRSAKAEVHGDEVRFAPAGDDHAARSSTGEFSFEIPAGWRKAPERPMRNASFYAGPGEDLECYVTVFPGEAGGILANVNRWRGQLGEPAIADADLAALHRIPMLGREAVLVECTGKGSQLVGAACAGADRSVFVKMSGPPERVQQQRSAFLQFCASIRSGN